MSPVPESLSGFRAAAVVVGGSAGAIDVLAALLPGLPGNFGVPIIIVVHVPPRRASLLPQLFAARCALPVREPEDKQQIAPGVWFAPPDYHLLIESDHTFALSIDEPVRFSRPSIDVLFESAARVYGPQLLGVVLTGANDDGAAGAREIRRWGGALAVQDPSTAVAPEMPRGALKFADPGWVGSVQELASMMILAGGGTP